MSAAAAALLLLAAPGAVYLAVLTIAAAAPLRRRPPAPLLQGRIAVIVPAHNEAVGLPRTLASLTPLARADAACDIIVIADNCDDDTAAVARAAGVIVLERSDALHRGKGCALAWALAQTALQEYAAYAFVDADSVADDRFISSLRRRFGAGAAALQCRYEVLDGDASPRTQLAEIALSCFNILRLRGRERLGASVGVLGNGFALSRATLEQTPWRASSVVEDLEYHLRLVAAGVRVEFVADSGVRGAMPSGAEGARIQRTRWEGGRLRMLREHGPRLAAAVLRGRWRLLEPLAELLLAPLALHAALLLAALLVAVFAESPVAVAAACGGLFIVVVHVVVAMRVAGLPLRRLAALTQAPAYLWWKLRLAPQIVAAAAANSEWRRTRRDGA